MAGSSSTLGSSKGGYRQPGNLNDANKKTRNNAIRGILANWKIADLDLAFPANIKPKSLGSSAIVNLKHISNRKSLAEAQALFLEECMDSKGEHVPLSFCHTDRVLKALKDTESANPKEAKSTANGAVEKSTTHKSAADTPKETANISAPKVAGDFIDPGYSIYPHFSLNSSPAAMKVDENQPPKPIPHSNGVAIPKKKSQVPGEASKSSATESSSGAEAHSPLAKKKRPLAAKSTDENQQQVPVLKKVRKENERALPEISKDVLVASVTGPSITDTLAPSFAEPSHAHSQSDDDPLAELDRIMEINRKENEKLFNANTAKLAPAVDGDGDTIIVDFEAGQNRSQSLGPLRTLKAKRTRSASPVRSTPRKAPAENRLSGNSKAQFDIHNDSDIELTVPKPTVRAPKPDMLVAKSSEKDNDQPDVGTLSARVPTVQMHSLPKKKDSTSILADAVAAATAARQAVPLQADPLREHCGNVQEVLKNFVNRGLVNLARPDQQALAKNLETIFATTMRHLEADIDWVFKKDGTGSW